MNKVWRHILVSGSMCCLDDDLPSFDGMFVDVADERPYLPYSPYDMIKVIEKHDGDGE